MPNSNQLSHFQVLNKLDAKLKSNIRLICVFGKEGKEVLIVSNDDHVHAYGTNIEGCLGLAPLNKRVATPTFVPDLSNKGIVELSYGSSHVIARTQNDELLTWGSNEYGQLGNGTLTSSSKPLTLPEFSRSKVTSIACGLLHSMVLTDSGDVYCWGFNQNGQIGNYAKGNQPTPAKLDKFNRDPIVSIAAGAAHSIALDKRGHLYSWGYNRFGQLGSGNTTAQNTPAPVYDLLNFRVQKVICGAYHSLILSTDGALYSFGSNEFKQLGKDVKHSNIPTEIVIKHANGTKKQVKDIAASVYCNISMAQTQDDVCYQWGKCGTELIATPKETPATSFHEIFSFSAESKVTYMPIYLNTALMRRDVSIDTRPITSSANGGFTSLYTEKVLRDKKRNDSEMIKILLWSAVHKTHKDSNSVGIYRNVIEFVRKNNYMDAIGGEDDDNNVDDLSEEVRKKYDNVRVMFENCYSDYTSLKGVFTQTGRYKREFDEMVQLGKGGFGFVFKARNKFDGNQYAVKKIGVQDEDDSKVKMKELTIWAQLNTIYVVQYKSSWIESNTSQYDCLDDISLSSSSSATIEKTFAESRMKHNPGLIEGKAILHIQMELCDRTLLDVINKEFRKLKPVLMAADYELLSAIGYYVAGELYTEILECVDYLHKQYPPVIHRDLKPANILITDGANGRFVKIADFGLATLHHFDQESHSQALGTRQYIAPEVYNTNKYNTKADIFSLGVIMRDLFSIDTLFDKSISAKLDKIVPLISEKYDAMAKFYNDMISHNANLRPNCEKVLSAKESWILTMDELQADKSFTRLRDILDSRDFLDKFFAHLLVQKLRAKESNNSYSSV